MDPIDSLAAEHALIRRFLDLLSLALERLRAGDRPPAELFAEAAAFAGSFNDVVHHVKEEEILFRGVGEECPGRFDLTFAGLISEHELGRELMAGIEALLPAYAAGDPGAATTLATRWETYLSLLRHHIHTEDYTLFPALRELVAAGELPTVVAEFEAERQRHGLEAAEAAEGRVTAMGALLVRFEREAEDEARR